jgi:hypothetical protein
VHLLEVYRTVKQKRRIAYVFMASGEVHITLADIRRGGFRIKIPANKLFMRS